MTRSSRFSLVWTMGHRTPRAAEKTAKITLFLLIVHFSAAGSGPAADNATPSAVVADLNATLIESMKGGDRIGFEGRYALLEPIIERHFAVDAMVRISVGKYWKILSSAQRHALIDLYTQWSAASYANRFDHYAGQKFEIVDNIVVGNRADVQSRLIKTDGETVDFLYKLVQIGAQWLILDIHVKGVSQLANTRAQFTAILDREGFESLVDSLKEKIAGLDRKTP